MALLSSQVRRAANRLAAQRGSLFGDAGIDVAARQQAKLPVLRAALGLARLWQRQRRVSEARGLVERTYGWFSEGHDTADLREAAALLDELD